MIENLVRKGARLDFIGSDGYIEPPERVWKDQTNRHDFEGYPITPLESSDLPLNWAARKANISMVRLLLESGAIPHLENTRV